MTLYQVDSFTDTLFQGNPAAVMLLDRWLPDSLMQSIAAENNLAETAFVVQEENDFRIRWFTPVAEVDLCGHATLAAAYVMYHETGYVHDLIRFQSRSGILLVKRDGTWLTMDFPADQFDSIAITPQLQKCCSSHILEAYLGKSDYMFVLTDLKALRESHFDMDAIKALGHRGVIFTAEGNDVDFVSRFFAPAFGIPEDPVTGSAHTTLTPYWSHRIGKTTLTARQVSDRGGFLKCELKGNRVLISGQAVMYMKGELFLNSR